MKAFFITVVLSTLLSFSYAQTGNGVSFVSGKSWEEVKVMAKEQHKKIFIDCYTTWCTWCRWLDRKVYPNDSVAAAIGKDYIALRLQFDSSQKDDAEIKAWYATTHQFINDYGITSFPTLLFLDADGSPITKTVGVETENYIQKFLVMLEDVKAPQNQYYHLLSRYKNGDRGVIFLRNFITAGNTAGEREIAGDAYRKYLDENLKKYDSGNVKFIAQSTYSSQDPYFDTLATNYAIYDSAVGIPLMGDRVLNIIFHEKAYPTVFYGKGQIPDYHYTLNEPNWNVLFEKINKKYPKWARAVIAYGKVCFYEDQELWEKWYESLQVFTKQYRQVILPETLSDYAKKIRKNFSKDSDKIQFAKQLEIR